MRYCGNSPELTAPLRFCDRLGACCISQYPPLKRTVFSSDAVKEVETVAAFCDIEFNRQREKTISQKMKEADHLVVIEGRRSEQRKLSTLKQGTKMPDTPTLAEREKGETRDKVADKIGMKHSTFVKASTIWNKAKEGK